MEEFPFEQYLYGPLPILVSCFSFKFLYASYYTKTNSFTAYQKEFQKNRHRNKEHHGKSVKYRTEIESTDFIKVALSCISISLSGF